MSNYINKYSNQSAYDADNTKQYPNTSLVGTEIVFAMAFGGLTVKYNIVDPTQEVTLFNGGGGSSTSSSTSGSGSGSGGALPTRMIVDGVEETPINTWRFETAGEHIVQYEFADNIVPAGFMADGGIPATEAIIGDDITEISFDSGTNIGAFTNSTLTTATIGNGVTTIGQDAFVGCMSLTSVTIGTGITSIGGSAFEHCLSLTSVTIEATTPPEISPSTFIGTPDNMVIYVPAALVNDYKSDWYESIQAIS